MTKITRHRSENYEFGFLNIKRPKPVRDSFKLNIQSILQLRRLEHKA